MLQVYLDGPPPVTERLAVGMAPRDINTARAKVQALLNEWQKNFGPTEIIDEWQRLLDMARTYVMVMDLLKRLENDLHE